MFCQAYYSSSIWCTAKLNRSHELWCILLHRLWPEMESKSAIHCSGKSFRGQSHFCYYTMQRGAGGLLKSNWNSNWALEAPRLCSTWCTRGSISGESVSLLDPPAAKEACVPCWDLAPSDFQFLCKFMESCAIIESCSSKKELFAQHHPTEVASDDQTNSCFPNSSPRLAWILF